MVDLSQTLIAIVEKADATHIVLSFVVLALVVVVREQLKAATEREKSLSHVLEKMTEVMTQLRIDIMRVVD